MKNREKWHRKITYNFKTNKQRELILIILFNRIKGVVRKKRNILDIK